jgi:hypothetical protein
LQKEFFSHARYEVPDNVEHIVAWIQVPSLSIVLDTKIIDRTKINEQALLRKYNDLIFFTIKSTYQGVQDGRRVEYQ